MSPADRVGAAGALAAAVVVALLHLALETSQGHVVGVDRTLYDVPLLCALQQAVADGGLPWVARAVGNGMPLVAEPGTGALYPLRWLAVPFAPETGVALFAGLHFALAAASAALLVRSFRVRAVAAAASGVAFAVAGPVADLALHGNYVVGATFLPLAWAAARRARRTGGAGALVTVVVALTLCLYGGEPQAFAVAAALVVAEAALAALCVWQARRGRYRARVPALAVGLLLVTPVLAVAVAGPQLAITLGESGAGGRGGLLEVEEALRGDLRPAVALGAVLPGVAARAVAPGVNLVEVAAGARATYSLWSVTPYLGLALLCAVGAGARWRRARPLAALAALGFAAALGRSLPVMPLLVTLVPPLRLFRYPQKYLVVTALFAIVAAAVVAEAAARSSSRCRTLARTLLAGLLVVLVGAVAVAGGADAVDGVALALRPGAREVGLPSLSMSLLLGLGHAGVAVGVAFVVVRVGRPRLLPVVVAADLAVAAVAAWPRGEPLVDVPAPAASLPPIDGEGAPLVCVEPKLVAVPLRIPGRDPAWSRALWQRLTGVPLLQACGGAPTPISYLALQARPNRLLEAALDEPATSTAAARALGCAYVVRDGAPVDPALEPAPLSALGELSRKSGRTVSAFRLSGSMPSAVVVAEPRLVAGDAAAIVDASLGDGAAAIDDPRATFAGALPRATATVSGLTGDDAGDVVVALAGAGPAVVAVRTTWLFGWHATQGGRALPVLRAAGQHVAVVVDDVRVGPVRLRYEPPGLIAGLVVGVAGVIGVIAAAALAAAVRFRRRGSSSPA